MPLRINPDVFATAGRSLANSLSQSDRLLAQLASGRRLNALSDDPAAAASFVQSRKAISESEQFQRNLSDLRSSLLVADSTLNSAVAMLTRAVTLGVQGATGTLSQSNRNAIAGEVRGITVQLVGLANISFRGQFLFAGTAISAPPFVIDSTQPSGVRYDGNSVVNSVELSRGQFAAVNLPGDQLFLDPSANVFRALEDLATALESGTGIDTAAVEVQAALNHVIARRAFFGSTLSRLDATESFLTRESFELNRAEVAVVGADLAEVITSLAQNQNGREALLAAAGRINQVNLFNFL